jgi:CBS domain-containing protein
MPDSGIQSCTPHCIYQEIEAAQSLEQLRALGVRMLDVVRFAIGTDTDIKNIVQLISQLNEAITLRLIALLESSESIRLPEGAAYLALGSEGRGEQTLRTDQDSAIVYLDDLSPDKLREVERFAIRLVNALEEIGVPRCPGNIMASNPQWRHSFTEWKRLLDQWITVPTPEHMLNFGMFQDLRPLHGNKVLGTKLLDHIRAAVLGNSLFFPNMACHAIRFPLPLTIFGRIRVEHRGENKGKVDIKKAGIFAITVGVNLLALEADVIGGTTWQKFEFLGKRGALAAGDLKTIEESFTFLVQLRLHWQLRELSANGRSTNHVNPQLLTDKERCQFRQALKGVRSFLRIMKNHYQLNFISQ